jgi:hypothetical protein
MDDFGLDRSRTDVEYSESLSSLVLTISMASFGSLPEADFIQLMTALGRRRRECYDSMPSEICPGTVNGRILRYSVQ